MRLSSVTRTTYAENMVKAIKKYPKIANEAVKDFEIRGIKGGLNANSMEEFMTKEKYFDDMFDKKGKITENGKEEILQLVKALGLSSKTSLVDFFDKAFKNTIETNSLRKVDELQRRRSLTKSSLY